MPNTTTNTSAMIKAEMWTQMLQMGLSSTFLPEGLFRDVTNQFTEGTKLIIPIVGEVVVSDANEDEPLSFDPVTTGTANLYITEHAGTSQKITQELREDSPYFAMQLEAALPNLQLTALKERYETHMLQVLNAAQTPNNANNINGFAHRWVANSETTPGVLGLRDFIHAKLAFNKAKIPSRGRIAIIDSTTEAAFDVKLANNAFANNPQFEGLVNTGFGRDHRFFRNIEGFDVYVSDYLPTITGTETITGGPTTGAQTSPTGARAQIFMSVFDDMTMPLMGAWRRRPEYQGGTETKDGKYDWFHLSARWGFGPQRLDSLCVCLTDPVKYV